MRQVLLDRGGLALETRPAELGGVTLADELLTPTRIYALDCLAIAVQCEARAFAHITGGGIAGNLARALGPDVDAVVDRSTWAPQPIFDLIARTGSVALDQLELTFNLGVGMVAVVPRARADDAMALAHSRGVAAWVLGEVTTGTGQVQMRAAYEGPAAAW